MKILPTLARHLGAALIGLAALQAHADPVVQDRIVDAAGLQIHTLQAGSGPETPVVLLHGYTETSHMWLPLIPRLADRRVVLAPDLPGAGTSSIPASGFDKKTLAQDIHAMVQAMGYRKVKLVGHDIGLMVAYAYAAQYPDEVESITLMDAFLPGVGDWTKVWLLRDLWHFHFYGDTPLKLVQGRERIYFEHFWNDFAADPKHSVPEADRQFYARTYGQPGRMAAGFEYFHAFPQDAEDFAGFAKTPLRMPMLVLAGERASGAFLIEQAKLVATSYNVYRNGSKVGSSTSTTYTDTGLIAGTTYSYTVTEIDPTAGESAQSSAVSAKTQSSFACTATTASNYAHVQAGRAHDSGGIAYANGSNQSMGLDNVFYTNTLAQTAAGYYVIGNCP